MLKINTNEQRYRMMQQAAQAGASQVGLSIPVGTCAVFLESQPNCQVGEDIELFFSDTNNSLVVRVLEIFPPLSDEQFRAAENYAAQEIHEVLAPVGVSEKEAQAMVKQTASGSEGDWTILIKEI